MNTEEDSKHKYKHSISFFLVVIEAGMIVSNPFPYIVIWYKC
jgi:hypothetical protein